MIQLDGIGKQYGGTRVPTPVLEGVSLTIAAGERVALTGASGSGKTTLMNIMGLLDTPSAGRLRLDGRATYFFTAREAAEARNRLIGFVFQSVHLMPHLPEMVETGMRLSKGQELLAIAGLDTFCVEGLIDEVDVNKLSVGQAVSIESDSFPGTPIFGKIGRTATEAEPTGGAGTLKFANQIMFSVEQERRKAIRIGMSARLTITTYNTILCSFHSLEISTKF